MNETSIETIELMIDDLTYFGEGFSDMFGNSSFIQKMKDEVPSVKELTNTNRPFNSLGVIRNFEGPKTRVKIAKKSLFS